MKPLSSHPLTPRPQLQQHQFNQSGLGSKFFWILLFSLMASCFSVMQAQNLMQNGSFESGNFTHWQNSGSTIVTGHNQCHSTYAAWINNNQGSSRAYAIQEIPGTSDKEYVLTFRAQRRTEGHNRVRLQAVDTDGNILSEVNVQIEKQSWETYTLTLTGTPDRTAFICVVVEGSDGGSIKVDCFELEESSSPSYSQSWNIGCDEKGTVDIYSSSVDCALSRNSEVKIPSSTSVDRVVVEVVYKSQNPGASVSANVNGSNITLNKVEIGGGSSGEYVYRGEWSGMAHTVYHNSATGSCGNGKGLQSLVVYAFRNQNSAVTSVGQFTSVSGYCDLQGFTLGIPKASGPRDLTVKLPISELTTDGRFLTINASAGSKSATKTIYGPPSGTCCVDVVEIELKDVPGNVNTVSFEVDTRRGSNPNGGGCGQSYVISGGMAVEVECPKDQCEDFYAIAESDLNLVEERIVSNIQTSCGTGNSNAFWHNCLFASGCSGSSKTWKAIGNPTFTEYTDGTAILDMTVQNLSKTDHKFQVYVLFDQRQKNPPSGSPKLDLCGITADPDWYYYQVTQGSLIGLEALEGANLSISRKSSSFQLGTGANLHEQNEFGASGWLFYNILSQPDSGPALRDDAALDINIRLSGKTYEFNSSSEKICAGEKANLEAFATGGTAPYTYKWSHGLGSGKTKMVHPSETTTYSVTITDNKGCETEDQVTVYVKECSKLGDKVWIDENGDGRQDSGEPGLDGVKVELKQNGRVIKTDHTSGGGNYLFDNLTSGSYKLCFTLPNGYKFTKQNVGSDDKDSDVKPNSGMTDIFILGDNESNLTIDAGLFRPASIGDLVFLDKNKNGKQDPDEKGLKDIPVELFNAAGNSLGSQLTNGNGLYYFGDLAPGKYYVKFSALSGLMFTTPNQGSNDTRDSDVDDSNGSGTTQLYTLTSNEYDPDIDAGLKCTVSVNAGNDLNTCEGQCVDIRATASGGSGTYTYKWDQGLGTGLKKTVCPTTTTTYKVTVTDVDGCCEVTDEITVRVKPCIDLQLIKSVNNASPNVGDIVTFTIRVTNDGPSQATGVNIEDVVPNGYSNISNISNGGTRSGSIINWNNQTFNAGQSRNYTFKAKVNAPGAGVNYDNIAEIVDADQFDEDSTPGNGADTDGDGRVGPLDPDGSQDPDDEDDGDNAEVNPETIDLQLIKSVNNASPNVGDIITFTIKVTNDGPSQATGVNIEDVVPNGYSNISNISNGGTRSGSIINWNNQTFNPGQSRNYTFKATVKAPGAGVNYDNIAEIVDADQFDEDSTPGNGADTDGDGRVGPLDPDGSQDPDDEDDGDNAEVTPQMADLELIKIVDNAAPAVGDQITFTIRVSNNGPSDATGVEVMDNVPNGYSNITAISAGGSRSGSVITWDDLSITNGSSVDLTFKATVLIPGTGVSYVNLAEITNSDQYDEDSTPNNGADTDNDGKVGPLDPDGSQDPGDEDDGDDAVVSPSCDLTADAGPDRSICEEDCTSLIASATGGSGSYYYVWDNGLGVSATHQVCPTSTTTYTVTVTDLVTGCEDVDAITVSVYPAVNVNAGANVTTCKGSCVDLEATPSGGKAPFTYAWSNGDNGKIIEVCPNANTSYTVTVTDANGCESSDMVTVETKECGSIGNFVFEDLNGNGQQDLGEPGINNVLVTLTDGAGNPLQTRRTQGNGAYLFDTLDAGNYMVIFELPTTFDAFTKSNTGPDATDSDANTQTGTSGIINLGAGENDLTVDAGMYQFASLGNFVWEDQNGNGVQDINEPGVNGILVRLLNDYGSVIETTFTFNNAGQDGYYSFDDLVPGTYTVEFNKPQNFEFTSSHNPLTSDDLDSDANPSTGRSPSVVLESGENDPTIDAGILQLGTIGDFVWNDLNGNGEQEAGEPGKNGVIVYLWEDMNEDGIPEGLVNTQITRTVAGQSGFYQFTDIRPGTYIVQFDSPQDCIPSPQNETGVNDSRDSDADPTTGNTEVITVISGTNNQTIDAGFYSPICVGDYVFEDVDNNGRQDAQDLGINGVTVNLFTSNGALIESQVTRPNPQSGQDGYYKFNVALPGDYYLEFDATDVNGDYLPTFENIGNDALDSDVDGSNGPNTTATFALKGGDDNRTLDAGFWTPSSLGNYVWEDLNIDGVQNDGRSSGLNGIIVELVESGTNFVVESQRTSNNPSNGNPGFYLFENLIPGDYYVRFIPPTGTNLIATDADQTGETLDSDLGTTNGPNTSPTVTLGRNEDRRDVDAGFFQPSKIGDYVFEDIGEGNALNGIQDANEGGLAGTTVTLIDAITMAPVPGVSPIVTPASGFYQFCVKPGTYFVRFAPPAGYITSPMDATSDNLDSDVTHTFGPNTTQAITIRYGESNPNVDAGYFDRALPVQLMTFDAEWNGEEVWVDWSTLSENNADSYIVERRFENEAEWISIGNQDAKGASNAMNYYSLVDDGINLEGIYFYRLKQMDQDGGYTYSQIESVFIDWDDSEAFDINVYPNPASHHLIIDYVGNIPSVDVKISIVSIEGKMNRQLLGTAHAQRLKVDLSTIPEGVYQIQLQDHDQLIQKTIVIVK